MQGAATKMMRDIIKEPQRCQMALCRGNPSGGRGLRSHCFVAQISTMSRIASASRLACEHRSLPRGTRAFYRGRDDGYPPPPAQIRTCATNAYGSYLG